MQTPKTNDSKGDDIKMVSFRISRKLWQRVKIRLVHERRSMQDLMTDLLERWLNSPKG